MANQELEKPTTEKDFFDYEKDPKKAFLEAVEYFLKENRPETASNCQVLADEHDRLLKEGEGTFVTIVKGKIVGEKFETRKEAVSFGRKNFGMGEMLVRQILKEAEPPVENEPPRDFYK
jgi:hypothetical protein